MRFAPQMLSRFSVRKLLANAFVAKMTRKKKEEPKVVFLKSAYKEQY